MDSIFQLPLFILLCIQSVLTVPLLLPLRGVALWFAQLIQAAKKNTASNSTILTLSVALFGLSLNSGWELMRQQTHHEISGMRETLVTIDTLRAQVSCTLCMLNLALVFFSRALAAALCKEDKMAKNLEAMKRQTRGLQTEYERLTAKGGSKAGDVSDEVQALKAQVDKLIAQKGTLQAESEAARKARSQAEATAEALKRQAGGLNAEYDRVVEENLSLQKKLGMAGVSGYTPQVDRFGKKDT